MNAIRLTVDEASCTSCGLCEERAPSNMEVPSGHDPARVIKQPIGESETADCFEASDYCPTGGLMASAIDEAAESEDAA